MTRVLTFPWIEEFIHLGTEGGVWGRNVKETVTTGLFFLQNCIITEVNSTQSLCTIVFEYGCHRLNE